VEVVDQVVILEVGSGGAGVMTAGTLLLDAAARAGLYGLMVRTSGPQIRGGEAAALLRIGTRPIATLDDRFDVLLAIDWQNLNRFGDEIPMGGHSLLVGDADAGDAPGIFLDQGARLVTLPLKKTAKAAGGAWVNMVALGVAGALAGLPQAALEDALRASWKRSAEALVPNLAALQQGVKLAQALDGVLPEPLAPSTAAPARPRWLLSGNEAAGLGACAAACASSPPTRSRRPPRCWNGWRRRAKVGGVLVQAEDELASINMIIGASYGGVPSLTATSGPGLALMTESLGLAVAAEVPIVVVDVMRGGPSTGIPAKSEQSDLNIAVYGLHGDAPHLVVAPNSIADCLFTTQWAVHLAERCRPPRSCCPTSSWAESRAVDRPPADPGLPAQRLMPPRARQAERYRATPTPPSGVSPMAVPGTPGYQYTADGLEHNERGTPSSQRRRPQRAARQAPAQARQHDYGEHWADIEGDGDWR
jgi:2-oxoglutarate ferredoxin oxidoreductase subunit alpha